MRLKLPIGFLIGFFLSSLASSLFAAQQYAMVRKGFFGQLEFGYLMAHYATDLDRYAASSGNQSAAGTTFPFRLSLGYNINKIYGVELGVMHYQDSANSSVEDITRKSKLDLTVVNALVLFHLKLNDSRSWVITPKFGFAFEHGELNYDYAATTPPPWGGANQQDDTKTRTFVAPTIGVEYDHSFNKHYAMSFGYQYFFSSSLNYTDPYKTAMSSIHYFSIGGIYKF